MPYKKAYKKKRRSSKLVKKLQRLVYQNKMLMKLSKATSSNIFFGVREANPVDSVGKIELSNRTTGVSGQDSLPLVIVPLLNILNGASSGNGILRLKNNGYDFASLANVQNMGATGNADATIGTGGDYKRILCRYIKANLLLRQHASKDAKFKVYLLKILHEDLDPQNITETDADRQDMKKLLYYNHFLRQQIANPILENMENITSDIASKFKILWEKEYHIQEQHADLDEAHYQEVKIFKRMDKLIRYTESPDLLGANSENPDTIVYNDYATNTTSVPDTRANIFLVITANTSVSDVDHATLYDKMTFDIATKVKYTAPSQDVHNV